MGNDCGNRTYPLNTQLNTLVECSDKETERYLRALRRATKLTTNDQDTQTLYSEYESINATLSRGYSTSRRLIYLVN